MARAATRLVLTLGLGVCLGTPAAGQSSQFGSRGLGLPTRPYSAHSLGMGGGLALFDNESALNPASIAGLPSLQSAGNATSSWRDSDNAAGSGFGRDTRIGLIQAAGPVHVTETGVVRFNAGISVSSYLDRNYGLASSDSITLRGERYLVRDTLISQGGLSDIRIAASWNSGGRVILGVAAHLITGAARVYTSRTVESDLYGLVRESREVSYLGYGASAGLNFRVSDRVALAGLARMDAPARIERDTTDLGTVAFPVTLGFGARATPHPRLLISGHLLHRGWARADDDLKALGGLGARSTMEFAGGIEWARNGRDVSRWPLRLGVHRATLPFPLEAGGQGREVGVSLGTGIRLGGGGRGGFDFAAQQVWRSEGTQWREQAFLLTVGISIRQ